MKNFLFLTSFLLLANATFSQQNGDWKADFSKSKVFIENLGQFDLEQTEQTGPIMYAIDFGSTRIFFGKKGVSYSFLEVKKKSRSERQEIMNSPVKTFAEHKQKERLAGKYLLRSDQVNLSWSNCSDAVILEGINPSSDYHSYSYNDAQNKHKSVNYAKGFEKIIYKNIYPNIDIEYTVHPIIGVKYAFIVHPGADASQIQLLYDREVQLINNEIKIKTIFGEIVDHSPLSFTQENPDVSIESNYTLKNRTVSFTLGAYDNSKTLIIDPWVQTPAFPDNWDCVWELDTDAAGNVYIIGGIMPLQLKKYNTAGVLQWTHNTPYDTTSWLGTMATDDLGNSYVTNGTYYAIEKVDNAGNVIWNNGSPSGGQLSTEFWNIAFNCDQTKLIVGGTGGNLDLHGRIYEINMANGNITSSVQVTAAGNLFGIPPQIQEVRAMSSAPNGRYYFVTLDTIGYMSDNFNLCSGSNSSLNRINHGVNWGYKSENFRVNNTGIKVIRADANFVYINKGNQLQKRSLANFSILGSVTIPGGVLSAPFLSDNVTENAGIDIDNCGNIYVGSKTGVYKFNSSLVQQAFYPTSFFVYDVRVGSSGEVVACGGTGTSSTATRSGGVQSFAASACAPIALTCCNTTICQPGSVCSSDAPFTLTAATPGGTWSGPGVNATTGLFSPSVAGAGTQTITYTLPCGSESITIVVSSCTSLTVCQETNGNLTVSGGVGPYNWAQYMPATSTPITTSAQCTSCGYTWFFGTCLNGVATVTSCNSPAYWSTFATNTTVTPPVTTQIQITDGSGSTLVFNPATVVPCVTNPCPTLTLTTSAQTNVACFGGSTGSATVSTSGGLAPYTYTWNPGGLTGASQTNLSAGTYSISILDANSCPGTGTVTITQPTSALSATANATNTNCGASTGTATASPAGGTTGYTYSWSPSGGTSINATNLAAGSYTVTVTDANGCQATANTTVSSNGGPTLNLVSSQDVSCNGSNDGQAVVSATGGSGALTYSWMPGSLTGTSQTNLAPATYTVTVTDAGGCSNSVTIPISQPSAINLSSSNIVGANCGASDGSAQVSASGGTGGYLYSWSPSGGSSASATNLSSGVYTVTVQDNSMCSQTISVVIPSIGGPTVTLQSSSDVSCFGGNDGTATVTQSGGTAPYTYTWTPTGGNAATATNLSAGNYTVAVTDNSGCVGALNVTINQATQIIINEIIIDANCGANDGSISVSANGGTGTYTYLWSPNGETTDVISNLAPGTYDVTVSDQAGCSNNGSYLVSTVGNLSVFATPTSSTINQGESVQLNATGGTSFSWTPSTGLSCTNCDNPIATPSSTTTYIVTSTDASGCSGSDTLTIFVIQVCGDIYVPTVFSPNGSGPAENNTLCVFGNCISELNYSVYNRWGEKVFETVDPQICWDGTYKDKPLNSGVFAYKLVVTLFDGTTVIDSGNVTLVR